MQASAAQSLAALQACFDLQGSCCQAHGRQVGHQGRCLRAAQPVRTHCIFCIWYLLQEGCQNLDPLQPDLQAAQCMRGSCSAPVQLYRTQGTTSNQRRTTFMMNCTSTNMHNKGCNECAQH